MQQVNEPIRRQATTLAADSDGAEQRDVFGRPPQFTVLHVLPSLDPATGGVAEAAVQLANHMRLFSCASEVLTLDAPNDASIGQRLIDTPVHKVGPGAGFYGFSPLLVRWLLDNAPRFDCIVVHGIWQFHSIAAAWASHRRHVSVFVFPHGMLDPWFKSTYPAKHLKKTIYWKLLERRVFSQAARVLFTCQAELDLAKQDFLSRFTNCSVVGFGIGSPPADAKGARDVFLSAYPELADKRIVLFLSRIHEKKGCDLLLDAFASVAAADDALTLVLAGPSDAGLLTRLKQQVEMHGLSDRVLWPGMLDGAMKWGALQAAEVFVLPSHQENFGIAVVEALACGTPVIVSNKVNIWREIEKGGGWICDDTLASLRTALSRWVDDVTAEMRAGMRESALASYERHFRIEAAAKRIVDLVSELGETKRSNAEGASRA